MAPEASQRQGVLPIKGDFPTGWRVCVNLAGRILHDISARIKSDASGNFDFPTGRRAQHWRCDSQNALKLPCHGSEF